MGIRRRLGLPKLIVGVAVGASPSLVRHKLAIEIY